MSPTQEMYGDFIRVLQEEFPLSALTADSGRMQENATNIATKVQNDYAVFMTLYNTKSKFAGAKRFTPDMAIEMQNFMVFPSFAFGFVVDMISDNYFPPMWQILLNEIIRSGIFFPAPTAGIDYEHWGFVSVDDDAKTEYEPAFPYVHERSDTAVSPEEAGRARGDALRRKTSLVSVNLVRSRGEARGAGGASGDEDEGDEGDGDGGEDDEEEGDGEGGTPRPAGVAAGGPVRTGSAGGGNANRTAFIWEGRAFAASHLVGGRRPPFLRNEDPHNEDSLTTDSVDALRFASRYVVLDSFKDKKMWDVVEQFGKKLVNGMKSRDKSESVEMSHISGAIKELEDHMVVDPRDPDRVPHPVFMFRSADVDGSKVPTTFVCVSKCALTMSFEGRQTVKEVLKSMRNMFTPVVQHILGHPFQVPGTEKHLPQYHDHYAVPTHDPECALFGSADFRAQNEPFERSHAGGNWVEATEFARQSVSPDAQWLDGTGARLQCTCFRSKRVVRSRGMHVNRNQHESMRNRIPFAPEFDEMRSFEVEQFPDDTATYDYFHDVLGWTDEAIGAEVTRYNPLRCSAAYIEPQEDRLGYPATDIARCIEKLQAAGGAGGHGRPQKRPRTERP